MSKNAGKVNKKIKEKIQDGLTKKPKTKKIQIKVTPKAQAKAKSAQPVSKNRSSSGSPKKTKKYQEKELIVVDETKGLIFENEKTLFGYFSHPIKALEEKYLKNYDYKVDFTKDEIIQKESLLESVLDDPTEIWVDSETFDDLSVYTLIKDIPDGDDIYFYIAVVYLEAEEKQPTFVFLHFATQDMGLVEIFRDRELIYHRKLESVQFAALEGDSLLEGDYLAIGLLESMIKLRSEKDIPPEKFKEFAEFREDTINNPDEIWRQVTSEGNILVNFIKEVSDHSIKDLHYVAVTEEDPESEVHSLLFSFPTQDVHLLERYRQGENLEAEDVSTESSH